MMSITDDQAALRRFAHERDWEQFHTPRNLVMALGSEVGELMEIFQWLTDHEAADVMSNEIKGEQVRHELADVYAYLLRLADVLDVPLSAALADKMVLNAKRYPAAAARGHARKYTEIKENL